MQATDYKERVKRKFNRASCSYFNHSSLQQEVGVQLVNLLQKTPLAINVINLIDVGCGEGSTTERLCAQLQPPSVTLLDMSNKLLSQADQRLRQYKPRPICADMDQWQATHTFSHLFTNMALHWSDNLARLIGNMKHWLCPGGLLAISLPLTGSLRELQPGSRQQFYNQQQIAHLLTASGFCLKQVVQQGMSQFFPSWYDALRSLKATGTTALTKPSNRWLSRRKLMQHQAVTMHYEVGYFIATKEDK